MSDKFDRIQQALEKISARPRDATPPNPSAPSSSAASTGAGLPEKRFRPWDRADLLRRLQGYKAQTWFAKPAAIAPPHCARHGWCNVDADTLQCDFCRAKLICRVPPGCRGQDLERYAPTVQSIPADMRPQLSRPIALLKVGTVQLAACRALYERCTAPPMILRFISPFVALAGWHKGTRQRWSRPMKQPAHGAACSAPQTS